MNKLEKLALDFLAEWRQQNGFPEEEPLDADAVADAAETMRLFADCAEGNIEDREKLSGLDVLEAKYLLKNGG